MILDPDDFPFTEADLLLAFRKTCALDEASFRTATVVEGIMEQIASEEAAAAARARGSKDPREVNSITVAFPWPVLLTLASASPELRERVDMLRRKWRAQQHSSRLMESAMHVPGWTRQNEVPSRAHEAVAKLYEAEERDWEAALAQFQFEHLSGDGEAEVMRG